MSWVSWFGPALWTVDGSAMWDGDELYVTYPDTFTLLPVEPPPRAERWRITVQSAESGSVGLFFYQNVPRWNYSITGFPGTVTQQLDLDGLIEGIQQLAIGSGITFRVVDLEYDDQAVRASNDVISGYLFDSKTGVSWDYSWRGLAISDIANHMFSFSTSQNWLDRWWGDWSAPPNQIDLVVYTPKAAGVWVWISTGFYPDPRQAVLWEKADLLPGENRISLRVDDAGYRWAQFGFVDAGEYPVDAVSGLELVILSFSVRRLNGPTPPKPADIALSMPPVQRFVLSIESGGQSSRLPMASFSARVVSGRPSYLSVVVPNAPAYIDQITLFSDGDIVVSWELFNPAANAVVSRSEIARANIERVDEAQGPKRSSVTITGHKQKTYYGNGNHEKPGLHQRNGNTVRIGFDPEIQPLDTLNGQIIDSVQINASGRGDAYMTVTTA